MGGDLLEIGGSLNLRDLSTDDRSAVVLSELAMQLVVVAELRCDAAKRAEVVAYLRSQNEKNLTLVADAIERME